MPARSIPGGGTLNATMYDTPITVPGNGEAHHRQELERSSSREAGGRVIT